MVVCQVCEKELGQITSQHLQTHEISVDEYKERFPDSMMADSTCHDEETIKKISESHKGKSLSEEHKKKISNGLKNFLKENPEVRSNQMKKRWKKESIRRKMLEDGVPRGIKKFFERNPEKREEFRQKAISNIDYEAKSRKMKEGKTPMDIEEYKQKQMEIIQSEEHRERASRHAKEMWEKRDKEPLKERMKNNNPMWNEEAYEKHSENIPSGEETYNWRGGKSRDPYPPKFNEHLKEEIRERDGRECFVCSMTSEEHKKKYNERLNVHHIDYDVDNCQKDNLVTVCIICNNRANYNRRFWEQWFNL